MIPRVEPFEAIAAAPEHARGLVSLFEAAASPCFCRYWHFAGDNNAWLERTACAPDDNRAELEGALAAGTDEARGVVAIAHETGQIVGWLKLAPASAMSKLYARRLYRGLPCFEGDRAGVLTVGCALVHPEWRRRGVAGALVGGAVRVAKGLGARAIEAFPRVPREPVADEELFTGPASAFADHGFVVANAFEPYPVLRLEL